MRVHIARIESGRFTDLPADRFETLAGLDRVRAHEVADDPDEADVILFTQCHMVDWRLVEIREHPLARRHWEKVVVYDERDRPWRSFPGIYVSMPASSFDPATQRAWGYLATPQAMEASREPDLLFSFVGSPTSRCREALFRLRHSDAVVEEVHNFMFWDESRPQYESHRERFREVLARSRFVLCPRGRGTSSFRLYETLACGRVPVIMSDDWVAPKGPDWPSCTIVWPESSPDGLIELLEDRDRDWHAMSAAARVAHETYFADEILFHRIADLCADLRLPERRMPSRRELRTRSVTATMRERTTNRRA